MLIWFVIFMLCMFLGVGERWGVLLLHGFVVSLVRWRIGEGNVMERCEGPGGWFEEGGGGF